MNMQATRPRYETQGDLSREALFSRMASEKFNCTFMKMPIRYGLDFAAMRDGKVVAFVEMKVRTNPVQQYPTYMVALSKLMAARELTASARVPSLLMVRWSDAWGQTDLSQFIGDVSFGGRKDRDDWQDMEPVCLIEMDRFKIYPDP